MIFAVLYTDIQSTLIKLTVNSLLITCNIVQMSKDITKRQGDKSFRMQTHLGIGESTVWTSFLAKRLWAKVWKPIILQLV